MNGCCFRTCNIKQVVPVEVFLPQLFRRLSKAYSISDLLYCLFRLFIDMCTIYAYSFLLEYSLLPQNMKQAVSSLEKQLNLRNI